MESLATFFTGLFKELDPGPGRRWVAITVIAFFVLSSLIAFEYETGYFYYASLQKKINMIGQMQTIYQSGVQSNPELYPVYQETVAELGSRTVYPAPILSLATIDGVALAKGFFAALLWIALAIAGLRGAFGKESSTNIIGGTAFLVIALFVGITGAVIPTVFNPFVNIICAPVAQLLLLVVVSSRMTRRPAQQATG